LFNKRDANDAQERLAKKGFIPMKWIGKCEADKVSRGTFDVTKSGMYGLVFDNTFSKQTSKTATFVLLTYPTGAPPHNANQLPKSQAGTNASSSRTSLGKHGSPRLGAAASESVDSLTSHKAGGAARSIAGRSEGGNAASYHVGTLLKRRRKKGQGYARRFFSLDYTTCTLSYYHNRNSSALRGAIPLSLAAVAADERRREISIDSGAEVWHLKASNAREFTDWARALERASRIALGLEPGITVTPPEHGTGQVPVSSAAAVVPGVRPEDDTEWQQVESLVSRIVGTRDALRRLVKDLGAQKHGRPHALSHPGFLSPETPASEDSEGYFAAPVEKRPPFWKRKSSAAASPLTPQNFQPTLSSALAVPSPGTVTTVTANGKKKAKLTSQEEASIHEHCSAILRDLDAAVLEFSNLLASHKRHHLMVPPPVAPRKSFESTTSTEEFFDAEAGDDGSRLMIINQQSEEDTPASEVEEVSIDDSSSISSVENENEFDVMPADGAKALFPPKPKSLVPLPIKESIIRRSAIPPVTVQPPSLIAFVRKNVGKDLSTISMPVSANEPLSMLQRSAEQLEYAHLLDTAAKQTEPKDRLLFVTAFAVSQFSNGRVKERAMRKPFNPLLGETYELLRTDSEVPGGFRLLVEKVAHRPAVRLAMHADSALWSFSQSPAPTQRFWGKSAEVTTEGRVRVALRLPDGTDELYSWATATMFLRNVVMGEKYIEPVGTMHVLNDSTGAKASVEFRGKGMFGGRSEDVHVECFGPDGASAGVSLTGTWTQGLKIMPGGEEIWRAGRLVDNPATTYGLPVFAASLNEITPIEKGRLPPTDSRLRPDQRLAEHGSLDEAEAWKVKLEEAQRQRRKALEEKGEEHRPRWFHKIATGQDGEEVWRLKGGKEGYWEERTRGTWNGVTEIFAV
jgi:hypothetical protein